MKKQSASLDVRHMIPRCCVVFSFSSTVWTSTFVRPQQRSQAKVRSPLQACNLSSKSVLVMFVSQSLLHQKDEELSSAPGFVRFVASYHSSLVY